MPQETLTFPPLYCIVGAYRLAHDPTLWKPMWEKCSHAAKQALIVATLWGILTWPFQRLFVYYFMSASASVTGFNAVYGRVVETADVTDDRLPFRIPVPSLQTFATFMFVIGQVHAIMEFWLRRKLRECRNTAYVQTVRSRGKAADWWTEYVEEFQNPPTEKAIKDAKKQAWYLKLASPVVRFVILKVFLLPMDFVPLFGMALGAALRSLTYGRLLHQSFFEAKRMSPFQIELWITERQHAYRSFGFVAALMERIPLIGMVFSISNRIGAAMWAHDLEKRQQRIRSSSSSSADATSSITSGIEPSGGAVKLEEFKNKPTLKKIYKNVQQDTTAGNEDEGMDSNFNGEGLAVLRCAQSQGRGVFTHLSFTFPLKLMSPVVSSRNATSQTLSRFPANDAAEGSQDLTRKAGGKVVNAMYVVGYGGGLVSGDSVELDVDVGMGCCLVVLTQGSTKVFKTRVSRPTRGVSTASFTSTHAARVEEVKVATRQNFRFLIRPNSTLVLLPDPVTCFANARYDQVQRFDLRDRTSSSCIVLDWITPGRTAVPPPPSQTKRLDHLDSFRPSSSTPHATAKDYSVPPRSAELWEFASYRSRNEMRIAGNVVARDTILLSQSENEFFVDPISGKKFTELARRNHPFGCYATLILAGIDAEEVGVKLEGEFEKIQQRPTTVVREEEVLWSLSSVEQGVRVVRLAGRDVEMVRRWLRDRLGGLERVVGRDLYRQALGS